MSDAERPPDEVRSEVSVQKGEAPERDGATRASQAQGSAAARAGPVQRADARVARCVPAASAPVVEPRRSPPC